MLKAAIEEGMTTLMQDGVQKVLLGQTTFKEVKTVAIKYSHSRTQIALIGLHYPSLTQNGILQPGFCELNLSSNTQNPANTPHHAPQGTFCDSGTM
jgi:hypothetical protein